MSMSAEIERLERLRAEGTLSEEEFREAKARVIREEGDESPLTADQIHGVETNLWCAGMHFSQLLTVFAGAGFIVPIVMWAMGKEKSAEVDLHGVNIINWLISSAIYWALAIVLCFLLVGFILVIPLAVVMFVFPIIGGIKALNGETWKYPMTIEFITPPHDVNEYGYNEEQYV